MSQLPTKYDKRGEKGTPERRAFFQEIGRRGGNKTKVKFTDPNSPDYDPNYYVNNGKKGGDVVISVYGRSHLSRIGKLSKPYSKEVK